MYVIGQLTKGPPRDHIYQHCPSLFTAIHSTIIYYYPTPRSYYAVDPLNPLSNPRISLLSIHFSTMVYNHYNTCADGSYMMQQEPQQEPQQPRSNLWPSSISSSTTMSTDDSDGSSSYSSCSDSDDCSSCGCAEPLPMALTPSKIPTSICCGDNDGADNIYFNEACCDANALPTMSAADVMNATMTRTSRLDCSGENSDSRSWLSVATLLRAGALVLVALVLASAAHSHHSLGSRVGEGLQLSEQNSLSQDVLLLAERDAHAMERDHSSLLTANDQLLSELSR